MYRSRLLDAVDSNRCLVLILAVALVVRLSLALIVQWTVDQPPARLCLISGDAEGYWELAQKIVARKDYSIYHPARHVLRVPGFPLLLAFSQSLFGESPMAARCLLALVGTAACGLTYWLGRELVDSTTGKIAAAYIALSPTQALFSVLILSETTFAAAMLVSLIAIARFIRRLPDRQMPLRATGEAALTGAPPLSPQPSVLGRRRAFGGATLAGILIGVATMVRPTWLYVGSLIAIGVLGSTWGRASNSPWRWGRIIAGLIFGVIVAVTPWTYRNYNVTGHFVPTTLWVGPSLYDGLNPRATGDSDMRFFDEDNLLSRMSEYDMDREYRRRAWEFAAAHPGQSAWLALTKQLRYWSLVPNAPQFQHVWLQWVVCLTVLPLFVFGVCGFWNARRDFGLLILTFGPVLLFAALHLLFVGSLRYRLPAEYPLAVASAMGLRQFFIPRGPPLASSR